MKSLIFDQLFETIYDEHIAICIYDRHIASFQPAISGQSFLGGSFIIEIADHDLWAFDPKLAFLPRWQVGSSLRANNAAAGVWYRKPGGAGPWGAQGGDMGYRGQFGHAVALQHGAIEATGHCVRQGAAHWGGAGENLLQRAEVIGINQGMLGQCKSDWRHNPHAPGAVVLANAQKQLQVEPWHGDQNTAAGQMHIHHHGHTIDVKERQEGGGGLTGTKLSALCGLIDIHRQVAMRQAHPFGQAGGSRGIGQRNAVAV